VEDKTKKEKKPTPPQEAIEKKPEGKPDNRINDALAKINQDLKERTPIPEAAQVKEGSQGNPQGTPGGDNSECSQYSARVKQRIVGNWMRLTGGNKPPRPPKIHAMINASGQITSTQFIQKSGDLSLDSSAMRAVENSSPLPAPPQNCEIALRGGITVQFGR
jgi:TonB family protein